MRPIPFGQLMNWVLEEYRKGGSIFGVADPVKHSDGQALPHHRSLRGRSQVL